MDEVEKVAIPDAAVEAALLKFFEDDRDRCHLDYLQAMRAAIQAALSVMGGEAEPVVSGPSDDQLPENPILPPMTDRGLCDPVIFIEWKD